MITECNILINSRINILSPELCSRRTPASKTGPKYFATQTKKRLYFLLFQCKY